MSYRTAVKTMLLSCAGLLAAAAPAQAQGFSVDSSALPDWGYGSLDWGDYDNDGDLDLVFCGISGSSTRSTDIFRNDGGVFTPTSAGLVGVRIGRVMWGDYDGDGDLDLLVAGEGSGVFPSWEARIYRNDGAGVFTDIDAGLIAVVGASADWGDYDNDGDLDLIIMGSTQNDILTTLYRNDGADTFVEVPTSLPNMNEGSVAWGDYDEDGDLDLVFTGQDWDLLQFRTYLIRNDGGGVFTQVNAGLFPLYAGRAVWGDYDQDGDLDILAAGSDSSGVAVHTFVYRNDGAGVFADIHATLDGAGEGGAVEWGDADADGDLDILMMAANFSRTKIWDYQGDSTFTEAPITLPHGCCGDIHWGDYDADGRLDLALTLILNDHAGVYHNDLPGVNQNPSPPDTLNAMVNGASVTLDWNSGDDAETSALGLTYNVRVGTGAGLDDVMPAMADAGTGQRRVARIGNVGSDRSWTLHGLAPGVYFWSVQAIDAGYAGSIFAAERSFVVGDACPVVLTGDANLSGDVTSADIIALVGYVFKGGVAPEPCVATGDVNCTGDVTSADIIALVNFVFKGGTAPCDVCSLIPGTWSCP